LRIAVWHNLPSGGGKRALHQHVRGLVGRGHTVEAWTLGDSDRSYLPLSALVEEHVLNYDAPRSGKLVASLSGALASYRNEALLMRAYDEACARSAREIEARDFDLLFANSAAPFYMPYVLRHVRRLPKVLYLQEPCRPLYEADPVLPWVGDAGAESGRRWADAVRSFARDWMRLPVLREQARLEWLNARACDEILVNSYYSRESVARAYGRDARVCYLGIDTEQFRPLGYERENFVVSVGAFNSLKGVDTVVESVARLPAPRPALVWVANFDDDEYRRRMSRLAADLGVDLRLKSRVTDAELLDILNRAAVFVYAPRLEPFGYAPLEANACGTPVVAVAEGGVREVVREGVNGLLVDREPEQIAAALDRLLRDKEFARRMCDTAVEYVRSEWNLKLSIDRLEERFFRLLAAKSEARNSANGRHTATDDESVDR
jgi:glycosyltransferase involved in cell wall biosynthesis